MMEYCVLNRYISILHRLSNPFFDRELGRYGIGGGQQFFLLQISENPGISFQELALQGCYDKATATRAVKKLEEKGYVTTETDKLDKRIRHLYVTKEAAAVIGKTWEALNSWVSLLTVGFSEEEKRQTVLLLDRMTENAKEPIR